jgi:hypothetical protein
VIATPFGLAMTPWFVIARSAATRQSSLGGDASHVRSTFHRLGWRAAMNVNPAWIPAFAGMTVVFG